MLKKVESTFLAKVNNILAALPFNLQLSLLFVTTRFISNYMVPFAVFLQLLAVETRKFIL